jgi:hypothetical protein
MGQQIFCLKSLPSIGGGEGASLRSVAKFLVPDGRREGWVGGRTKSREGEAAERRSNKREV